MEVGVLERFASMMRSQSSKFKGVIDVDSSVAMLERSDFPAGQLFQDCWLAFMIDLITESECIDHPGSVGSD